MPRSFSYALIVRRGQSPRSAISRCCLAEAPEALAHPSWEGLPTPVDTPQRLASRLVHLHAVAPGRTLGVLAHLGPELRVTHIPIGQPLDLLEVIHFAPPFSLSPGPLPGLL